MMNRTVLAVLVVICLAGTASCRRKEVVCERETDYHYWWYVLL